MFTEHQIIVCGSTLVGLPISGYIVKSIVDTWHIHRGESTKKNDDKNAAEIQQETEFRKLNMDSMARNIESLEKQISGLISRISDLDASNARFRVETETERVARRKAEDEVADALALLHRTQLQLAHEKDKTDQLIETLNEERMQCERDTIALKAEHIGHKKAEELGNAVIDHLAEADIRPDDLSYPSM